MARVTRSAAKTGGKSEDAGPAGKIGKSKTDGRKNQATNPKFTPLASKHSKPLPPRASARLAARTHPSSPPAPLVGSTSKTAPVTAYSQQVTASSTSKAKTPALEVPEEGWYDERGFWREPSRDAAAPHSSFVPPHPARDRSSGAQGGSTSARTRAISPLPPQGSPSPPLTDLRTPHLQRRSHNDRPPSSTAPIVIKPKPILRRVKTVVLSHPEDVFGGLGGQHLREAREPLVIPRARSAAEGFAEETSDDESVDHPVYRPSTRRSRARTARRLPYLPSSDDDEGDDEGGEDDPLLVHHPADKSSSPLAEAKAPPASQWRGPVSYIAPANTQSAAPLRLRERTSPSSSATPPPQPSSHEELVPESAEDDEGEDEDEQPVSVSPPLQQHAASPPQPAQPRAQSHRPRQTTYSKRRTHVFKAGMPDPVRPLHPVELSQTASRSPSAPRASQESGQRSRVSDSQATVTASPVNGDHDVSVKEKRKRGKEQAAVAVDEGEATEEGEDELWSDEEQNKSPTKRRGPLLTLTRAGMEKMGDKEAYGAEWREEVRERKRRRMAMAQEADVAQGAQTTPKLLLSRTKSCQARLESYIRAVSKPHKRSTKKSRKRIRPPPGYTLRVFKTATFAQYTEIWREQFLTPTANPFPPGTWSGQRDLPGRRGRGARGRVTTQEPTPMREEIDVEQSGRQAPKKAGNLRKVAVGKQIPRPRKADPIPVAHPRAATHVVPAQTARGGRVDNASGGERRAGMASARPEGRENAKVQRDAGHGEALKVDKGKRRAEGERPADSRQPKTSMSTSSRPPEHIPPINQDQAADEPAPASPVFDGDFPHSRGLRRADTITITYDPMSASQRQVLYEMLEQSNLPTEGVLISARPTATQSRASAVRTRDPQEAIRVYPSPQTANAQPSSIGPVNSTQGRPRTQQAQSSVVPPTATAASGWPKHMSGLEIADHLMERQATRPQTRKEKQEARERRVREKRLAERARKEAEAREGSSSGGGELQSRGLGAGRGEREEEEDRHVKEGRNEAPATQHAAPGRSQARAPPSSTARSSRPLSHFATPSRTDLKRTNTTTASSPLKRQRTVTQLQPLHTRPSGGPMSTSFRPVLRTATQPAPSQMYLPSGSRGSFVPPSTQPRQLESTQIGTSQALSKTQVSSSRPNHRNFRAASSDSDIPSAPSDIFSRGTPYIPSPSPNYPHPDQAVQGQAQQLSASPSPPVITRQAKMPRTRAGMARTRSIGLSMRSGGAATQGSAATQMVYSQKQGGNPFSQFKSPLKSAAGSRASLGGRSRESEMGEGHGRSGGEKRTAGTSIA
ncbi:hypothetical protein IAT38_007599 [Cryptococcus sp. DSM 104549]